MKRRKFKGYYNYRKRNSGHLKRATPKSELMSLTYNLLLIVLLIIFLRLFGLKNFDSIIYAILGRLAFWLVSLIFGKKKLAIK